jgi:hypothetical protein
VDVVAVCRSLGLDTTLARRWRELPDPPGEAALEPAADPDTGWRGSG